MICSNKRNAIEVLETNSTYERTLLKMSDYDANGGSVSQGSPIHVGNRRVIETVAQNLLLMNDYFKIISSHFLGSYINIFHEKEIQTVILRG